MTTLPEETKADRIRLVATDELVGSIIDAARILPLVGWDVDLAIAYRVEEIGREMEADDRRYAKNRGGVR